MTSSLLSRSLCLAAFAAFAAYSAAPAQAASTAASSASSAGSASSGSVSDSIGASSNSAGGDDRVAAGQYQVIDIAQAPAKSETTRMTLRAVAAGTGAAREFTLDVPNRALAARRVAAGDRVQVNERVYGYEFAHADTNKAFFLALQDAWYRELGSHKVAI
jgi:type IV secretory pathway TrbL component